MIVKTGRVGDEGLDITIKSAQGFGKQLAPTWELVGGHKRWAAEQAGQSPPAWTLRYEAIDDAEYTQRYLELLRARYRVNRDEWHEFVRAHEEVTLLCYCAHGKFCHRDIAADVLEKVARALEK